MAQAQQIGVKGSSTIDPRLQKASYGERPSGRAYLSPEQVEPWGHRVCWPQNLKRKWKALQPLLCPPDTNVLPCAPTILPSSPAELRHWKAKILIKTAQKAENAWNKVTVTVKRPEMPIRNCNTGVLLQLTPP